MTDGEFKMTIYYEGSDDLKDFLVHDGVKNMKWHNRRYQYPDGSLTPLGRKHYGVGPPRNKKDPTVNLQADSRRADQASQRDAKRRSGEKKSAYSRAFEPNIKNGKDKPNTSAVQNIAKESNNIVENASRGVSAYNRLSRNKRQEPINMSDEELRRRINRLNMEKQYRYLKSENTRSGYEKAKDVLEVIGSMTAIAASVAGIASTVYTIKHS